MSGSAAAAANRSDSSAFPNDALVDEMEFRVGARPDDLAGVADLIARREQRHVGPMASTMPAAS